MLPAPAEVSLVRTKGLALEAHVCVLFLALMRNPSLLFQLSSFLVGGGLLGVAQNQGQLGLGLGGSTSTSGGLFGNQQRLSGGLFGNTSTQNKIGGGLGTSGGLFGQQQTSQAGGGLFGNTGGGLFGQQGTGTQLGGALGGQTQVSLVRKGQAQVSLWLGKSRHR